MTTVAESASVQTLDVPLGRTSAARRCEIQVDLRFVIKTLLCIVTTLVILGTAANFITYQVAPSPEHKVAKLMHRFDLGYEPSIPNWYSSLALMASGVLLAVIGIAKRGLGDRFAKHWFVLAAMFLLFSIDENVRIHEMIHTVLIRFVHGHGLFYFPWVVPATLFVMIVAFAYLKFLRNLDPKTAVLFITAGGVYVAGAVGIDSIGGMMIEQFGVESIQHTFSQSIEECLEMLGIVIFLYALLDYIRRVVGPINVRVISTPGTRVLQPSRGT